jgi:hypothetical protein
MGQNRELQTANISAAENLQQKIETRSSKQPNNDTQKTYSAVDKSADKIQKNQQKQTPPKGQLMPYINMI